MANPGAPPVNSGFGALDAEGAASVDVSRPSASDPALAGAVLQHAFVVLGATGEPLIVHASNALPLTLTP